MKIGIVTQPLAANYGGILQNFALQTVLIQMGHSPITLRVGKKTYSLFFKQLVFYIVKRIIGIEVKKPEIPFLFRKRQAGMERFVNNKIITTPLNVWFDANDIEKYSIDVLIVGSDQVWRPDYNRHIEDMFLRFAAKYNIKKIAYAASFGTDKWLYTQEQTNCCKELIKCFNAISVRENTGVQLCADYLGRDDAVWVLDPTMLLHKEDYLILCENIQVSKERYLYAYILDINEKKINLIRSIAESRDLKVIIISAQDQTCKTDTIEKWIAMFRDASYIITDSFHGIVFCLIFKKEFYAFKNHERGSARFDSLISIFEIGDRFIDIEKEEDINSEINWEVIGKKLNDFRVISNRYLCNALT